MNGYCQVYLYEDVNGGYTLHVATHKVPPGAPEHDINVLIERGLDAYQEQNNLYKEWRKSVKPIPIEHEYAGQSYNLNTLGEVISLLTEMRTAGVIFPDYLIEVLAEEDLHTQQEY